jgi:hypothetical protein
MAEDHFAVVVLDVLVEPQARPQQDRDRRRASASTINGKRSVRSLPGRL